MFIISYIEININVPVKGRSDMSTHAGTPQCGNVTPLYIHITSCSPLPNTVALFINTDSVETLVTISYT